MSFSKEVKVELSKLANLSNKKEVEMEFLGYLLSKNISEEGNYIRFSTENDYNIDRFAKVIRNIGIEKFNIDINGKNFYIEIDKKSVDRFQKFDYKKTDIYENINDIKAYIRGLFMGSGSINDPKKRYHLECSFNNEKEAQEVLDLLRKFDIYFKKGKLKLYLKDGEEISKFLAFIGANKAVIKFEEIRVQRSMNNKVNRLVNCESANFNKVLNASIEQVNAIRKLKKNGGFKKLDDNLKEIAELRLKFPNISLVELGQKLEQPIGKSGVNYRLKKIVKLAE